MAWWRHRWALVSGAIVVVALALFGMSQAYSKAKVVTLGQASAALATCLHAHGARMARMAETGRWQATFPDGRAARFYFEGAATEASPYLIGSFDPSSRVIGIHPRVPPGGDARVLGACARGAGLGD